MQQAGKAGTPLPTVSWPPNVNQSEGLTPKIVKQLGPHVCHEVVAISELGGLCKKPRGYIQRDFGLEVYGSLCGFAPCTGYLVAHGT